MTDPRPTVLVTGSSRGIGRAIALDLAAAGYDLIVHCVASRDAADAVAAAACEHGASARVLQFDVSDRAACKDVLEAEVAEHGAPYGLVLNSGIARDGAFPMLGDDDWDAVLRTNLDGFYNVVHPLVMPLIRRRKPGRIVTMSSVSGLIGNRGQVNYSASKAGIIGATKALAVELASRKITVNCVAPGLIATDMLGDMPEDVKKRILEQIPAGRLGDPAEVAATVRFLLSADAAYITRQVISVNGGMA
ncbi:MAG: 3-ketoacyl-ACP reductase FabG2 [Pseudomonadota bacterium]